MSYADEQLAEIAQRSGATSGGLPYPSPTDPVSEGAAAIQALADELEKRLMRQSWAVRYAGVSSTAQTVMVWEAVPLDELAAIAAGQDRFLIAQTGQYLALANLAFAGATGTGGTNLKIWRADSGGALVNVIAAQDGGLNERLSALGFWTLAAGDQVKVTHQAGATGTGHTVTGEAMLWRIG